MALTITQLPKDAWQQYRTIRLAALQSDPIAFGGTYEEESLKPEQEWRDRMTSMWFAILDNEVIGSIGLVRRTDSRSSHRAYIVSFWVNPQHRGKKIGQQLVQQVQESACLQKIHKICLEVTCAQKSAIAVYQKTGFAIVGHFKDELYDGNSYHDTYAMEWFTKSA